MWQTLITVALTAGILLVIWILSLRYLASITQKSIQSTAEVLVASLNPPITDDRQPADQPDLLDPNWTPGPDGLPTPPWMPGNEQSPYSTSS